MNETNEEKLARLESFLHSYYVHPDYEYKEVTFFDHGEKEENLRPAGDGWERNVDLHGGFKDWQHHKSIYWRRFAGVDEGPVERWKEVIK